MPLPHRPGISTPKGAKYPPFRRAFRLSECFKPGSDGNHAEKADLDRNGAMRQSPACSAGMQCRKCYVCVRCASSRVPTSAPPGARNEPSKNPLVTVLTTVGCGWAGEHSAFRQHG